jgi:hypothetical protein
VFEHWCYGNEFKPSPSAVGDFVTISFLEDFANLAA